MTLISNSLSKTGCPSKLRPEQTDAKNKICLQVGSMGNPCSCSKMHTSRARKRILPARSSAGINSQNENWSKVMVSH